jgi:hypothetical protein
MTPVSLAITGLVLAFLPMTLIRIVSWLPGMKGVRAKNAVAGMGEHLGATMWSLKALMALSFVTIPVGLLAVMASIIWAVVRLF